MKRLFQVASPGILHIKAAKGLFLVQARLFLQAASKLRDAARTLSAVFREVPGITACDRKIGFMRIRDEAKQTTVFLGYNQQPGFDTPRYGGTGLMTVVSEHGRYFSYIVTNDHVAQEIEQYADPFARLNDKDGRGYQVSLRGATWHRHADQSVDLAICEFAPPDYAAIMYVPPDQFMTLDRFHDYGIGIGDDVFMVGLLVLAPGSTGNTPVVRCGNIAMLPQDLIKTKTTYGDVDAYLVEARSLGGLSGSPVFVRMTIGDAVTLEDGDTHALSLGPTFLLGIVQGHWNIDASTLNDMYFAVTKPNEGVNIGLAIVIAADKIVEILGSSAVRAGRERAATLLNESTEPGSSLDGGSP